MLRFQRGVNEKLFARMHFLGLGSLSDTLQEQAVRQRLGKGDAADQAAEQLLVYLREKVPKDPETKESRGERPALRPTGAAS